jgi:ornithine cyclodeaminase/alanine dehydrogenase-like protein (mu-crystallin family)
MLNAEQVTSLAPIARVIDCLEETFRTALVAPPRQVVAVPGGDGGRLMLLMPAFACSGSGAVKLATVFPDNAAHARPTIQGLIIVFSETGEPCAAMDGASVTRLRTAAASALASRFLSRVDSTRLAILGTGAMAPHLAAAHCAVRRISQVAVWGRDRENAQRAAKRMRALLGEAVQVRVENEAALAVRGTDIVSCCTSSATPILQGAWLEPGTFVDLIGSFSSSRRESDDEVIRRSRIFVDTWEGAMSEAGDLLEPMARGLLARENIAGELADLVTGRITGRTDPRQIITFKSVGTAIEDLATARMIVAAAQERSTAAPRA